jgi:hypothetical protein
MSNLKLDCLFRLQKKTRYKKVRLFPRSVISLNGGIWKLKNFNFFIMWTLTSIFFLKSCLFLRAKMENPPSIFAGGTTKCMYIDWCLEISIFMLYAAVNATRSLRKATDWNGIKNGKPPKTIWLSWFQSIDKKQFEVCVKFEVGSLIQFTKKN